MKVDCALAMTPDRRHRISDLYHATLSKQPEEREAFLIEACDGDEALREELRSMLRYEPELSGFLGIPVASVAAALGGDEPAVAMIGRQIGPYRIVAPLGKGGMGVVYRARDSKLNREAAIKVLPPHLTEDPERRARLAREARLLATLNHPNVGAIYGLEELDGVNALVLELVEGPTLAERIDGGPLPLSQALAIAHQVAAALDAAHAKGIVHRDLKPSNIVLHGGPDAYDVRAKVLDFGLAKSTPLSPDDEPTRSLHDSLDGRADGRGRILGTPAYMSPEQARGLPVDKRTDVWAFGCVLFEMLAGRPPFEADSAAETVVRVLEREPDWNALPPTLPRPMQALLRQCLQKDPVRRVRDVRDAMLRLDDALATEGADAVARAAPRRRLGWPHAVLGAALLAAAVVAAWRLRPAADPALPNAPGLHLDVDLGLDLSLDPTFNPVIGIAPAGDRLVFLANGRLVTRRLEQPRGLPIAGTEGATAFFFSPDGQSIAFAADRHLKRAAFDGATVETICEIPATGLRGGTWGDDGSIVFATMVGGLFRVPAGGGRAEPLTRLTAGEFSHRWPQFLPGGQAVIFTSHAYPDWFDHARIEVMSLADGRRRTLQTEAAFGRIAAGVTGPAYLTFVRAGTMYAVRFDPVRLETIGAPSAVLEHVAYNASLGAAQLDVSRTGTLIYRREVETGVSWLESTGAAPRVLEGSDGYVGPAVSPDGTRLAYALGDDLWVYDLGRKIRTQVTKGIQAAGPQWTPDGRFLVFSTFDNLAWIPSDGGSAPQLLLPSGHSVVRFPTATVATDGGMRLAFMALELGRGTAWDVWTVSVASDSSGLRAATPEPFLKTSYDERQLGFSIDGRWVAYSSTESGERHEIYVRHFPDDGRRWKISDGGGTLPQWSPDGAALFYQAANRTLMRVPYETTAAGFVPGAPRQWSAQSMVGYRGPKVYSVAGPGPRVAALVADAASEERSQHVVTLWTDFLDQLQRRPAAAGRR
jgi:eukaryotic-like serine/threonine-protein kinase